MAKLLEHKIALVTGAGSGIGREIAFQFADEGAAVVVCDISVEGGRETAARIRDKARHALFFRADTSKPEKCEATVDAALREFGPLQTRRDRAH